MNYIGKIATMGTLLAATALSPYDADAGIFRRGRARNTQRINYSAPADNKPYETPTPTNTSDDGKTVGPNYITPQPKKPTEQRESESTIFSLLFDGFLTPIPKPKE